MIRRAGELKVSMSTLVQAALTVIIGYLLNMVLGLDAKLARLDEQLKALRNETTIHAEHSRESIAVAEKSHTAIWDALRRKQDKRE